MLVDPVANMLTVMRNAIMAKKNQVSFPFSNFKWRICQKLLELKFLQECKKKNDRSIKALFAYENGRCAIWALKKLSTPSQHRHYKVFEINKRCSFGTFIISTSSGLLTNSEAFQKKVGGKVLLKVN